MLTRHVIHGGIADESRGKERSELRKAAADFGWRSGQAGKSTGSMLIAFRRATISLWAPSAIWILALRVA
jgi:hypothetical protein